MGSDRRFMNPLLQHLKPYPFERLAQLHAGIKPPADTPLINLSIGEPQHPTPALIMEALARHASGYAKYPVTRGELALREAIAGWLTRRHGIAIKADGQVLPLNGSREGLFSVTQALLDPADREAIVIAPNPFYQIYEGAALLAGATPYYVSLTAAHQFAVDWDGIPDSIWRRTRLVFTCSPNNPTGRVMPLAEWAKLFTLADRYGFTIVSDECYSEIYFDPAKPPLGALAAAATLGRLDFARLLVMGSLSKRSNAPGLRSGYVAGDTALIKGFLLYRTYHGCAMSLPVQMASIAAWDDEAHVRDNRRLYANKFQLFYDQLAPLTPVSMPDAAFYFWLRVQGSDEAYSQALYAEAGLITLPGSYLSRPAQDGSGNPGEGYLRLALVASLNDARIAADRLTHFLRRNSRHAGIPH
jgi:N-succinyldiaminopimelate aminotransferase